MKLYYMKPIKEYINDNLITGKEIFEGLFDSEDDLLDKELSTKGLNWLLDRRNACINNNAEEKLKVKDNGEIIYLDSQFKPLVVTLYKPLPDWIKFDDNLSNDRLEFILNYPVKTQADIPSIGYIRSVRGDLHNMIIKVSQGFHQNRIVFNSCNSIKKLTLDAPEGSDILIKIENSRATFKDFANIKTTANYNEIIIFSAVACSGDLRGDLLKALKNEQSLDDFINKNQQDLRKMHDNGIVKIIYNKYFCVNLEETIDDDGNRLVKLFKTKVGNGSLKYYINSWD